MPLRGSLHMLTASLVYNAVLFGFKTALKTHLRNNWGDVDSVKIYPNVLACLVY